MRTSHGPDDSEHLEQLQARLHAAFDRDDVQFAPPAVDEAVERLRERRMAIADQTIAKAVASVSNPTERARSARVLTGSSPTGLRRWGWLASATLAVAMVCGALLWPFAKGSVIPGPTYATTLTQRGTLTLRDGTRVTIAPQTTVRLTEFSANARTVDVDGEAYFEVSQSSGAPFAVRSGGVTARVLGTSFMVRRFKGDRSVRVAVAEGKVQVASSNPSQPSVTLTVGHVAEVSDSTVKVLFVDDATSSDGWVDGKLRFHNTPLSVVLQALGRWYGYQFRLADSARVRERVTLTLNTHSSSAALANLEQLLGMQFMVIGDTVTFTPRTAPPETKMRRLQPYEVFTPTRKVGR